VSGFLVDTNVLSEFSRTGAPEVRVKNWLKHTANRQLNAFLLRPRRKNRPAVADGLGHGEHVCRNEDSIILTLAEIRRGIEVLAAGKRRGQLEKCLETDLMDGLIAATALEHDLTLATRNVKDFAGLPVRLLNPWEA
jgi:toxin FitB